jgi:hypothetical protein
MVSASPWSYSCLFRLEKYSHNPDVMNYVSHSSMGENCGYCYFLSSFSLSIFPTFLFLMLVPAVAKVDTPPRFSSQN